MGKRTSVYLPDALAASLDASPLTLGELIARGLACPGHDPGAGVPQPARREPSPQPRPAAREPAPGKTCKHPGTGPKMRCKACGGYNV